jgi:hypothetical protein
VFAAKVYLSFTLNSRDIIKHPIQSVKEEMRGNSGNLILAVSGAVFAMSTLSVNFFSLEPLQPILSRIRGPEEVWITSVKYRTSLIQ